MAVGDATRATATERRRNLIRELSGNLDPHNPAGAVSMLRKRIETAEANESSGPRMPVIASGDIDGLVTAMMFCHVVQGAKVVALVGGSAMSTRASDTAGKVGVAPAPNAGAVIGARQLYMVHPDFVNIDITSLFGIDVFSPHFSSISNHPCLWGDKRPNNSEELGRISRAYDDQILKQASNHVFANANVWLRIQGARDSANVATSMRYKYPLGSAQLALALLERLDRTPPFFDREYLPWLVANCDGGLKTIRDYAFNVPMWWGCLAAAVGPASYSEQLFQLASNQRPTQFADVVNRLRSENSGSAKSIATYLDDDWNLVGSLTESLPVVVDWISGLSGWRDPFWEGAPQLKEWAGVPPTSNHFIQSSSSHEYGVFRDGLEAALNAVHANFAAFERQGLFAVGPWDGAIVPRLKLELEEPAQGSLM